MRIPSLSSGLAGAWFTNTTILAIVFTTSLVLFTALNSANLVRAALGATGLLLLLLYPELALAVYLVIGDLKGNERIAALFPFDLTLAASVVLIAGILLRLIRRKPAVSMPPVYFLFVALATIMAISLVYTPVFSAGLEKLVLFLTVTALAIVAPFFVLVETRTTKRFLWCFGGAGYAICLMSLAGLGGAGRLVTPSDNTIGLGRLACVTATMIWFAGIIKEPWRRKLVAYAALSVPLIAMIGSGSRGSAVAFTLAIAISVFIYKRSIIDVVGLGLFGLAVVPFLKIPESSFEYLSSLTGAQSFGGLLDFRADLLEHGWRLVREHPLIGAGIGGFRYSSPNPGMYKWPHDIFLELGCELGIPAALIGGAIFACAVRESLRQLRNPTSPFFRLSTIGAALLCIGMVAAVTTGNINSDRSIWFFVSLVFVIGAQRRAGRGLTYPLDRRIASEPLGEAHV